VHKSCVPTFMDGPEHVSDGHSRLVFDQCLEYWVFLFFGKHATPSYGKCISSWESIYDIGCLLIL
jgi:hypothetical protein